MKNSTAIQPYAGEREDSPLFTVEKNLEQLLDESRRENSLLKIEIDRCNQLINNLCEQLSMEESRVVTAIQQLSEINRKYMELRQSLGIKEENNSQVPVIKLSYYYHK